MGQVDPIAERRAATTPRCAIVARFEGDESHEKYLRVERDDVFWETDSARATPFPSLREASRAAFRLPSAWRAFGLPLIAEATCAAA